MNSARYFAGKVIGKDCENPVFHFLTGIFNTMRQRGFDNIALKFHNNFTTAKG